MLRVSTWASHVPPGILERAASAQEIRTRELRRIGILGHYHGNNQGDECVVAALAQSIRARCPGAEIAGFSLNPADTRERHQMPAYPLRSRRDRVAPRRAPVPPQPHGWLWTRLRRSRWLRRLAHRWLRASRAGRNLLREPAFLWRSYRRLQSFDLLIVAGSGPLSDEWAGPWSHPYTLFKWACLARATGTPFVPLCVGAGPIESPLTRWFLRRVLRSSAYRSFRDPSSAALAESLGAGGGNPVFPDLGFSLDLTETLRKIEGCPRPSGGRVVGLNPMPHMDERYIPRGERTRYEAYLRKLSEFARWLIANDFKVLVLYSQLVADPRVAEDFCALLEDELGADPGDRLLRPAIGNFDEMVAAIHSCDLVVASRYHLIILPQMLLKPVVALAYHDKTRDLMASMGQAEYCLDIDAFDAPALIEAFSRLRAAEQQVKVTLAERVSQHRSALARQYDRLLGPVGGGGCA